MWGKGLLPRFTEMPHSCVPGHLDYIKQWFAKVTGHQNHLEGYHTYFQDPPLLVSHSGGLEGPRICISNKLPGDASAAGPGTPHYRNHWYEAVSYRCSAGFIFWAKEPWTKSELPLWASFPEVGNLCVSCFTDCLLCGPEKERKPQASWFIHTKGKCPHMRLLIHCSIKLWSLKLSQYLAGRKAALSSLFHVMCE